MEYRRLGHSGLQVSTLSLGSWVTYGCTVDNQAARSCVLAAYEGGVNFFDSAEAYGQGSAETALGPILAELRREDLVISSKVFWGGDGPNDSGLSAKHVVEACHAALKRMRLDYLDLYFCHRHDPDTPVLETARAMDGLIKQGKVLYWGTSEWTAEQLTEAYEVCDRYGLQPPTMEQPQYNMFHRARVEKDLVPHFRDRGLGTTTWSPLASGLLTGKYNNGIPENSRLGHADFSWLAEHVISEDRIQKVRALEPIANDLDCSMAQLAIAWATLSPWVSTVITGASCLEQVHENLDALEVAQRIDQTAINRIESILCNQPG
ncbi:MAG: aldo/keto reductase [Myxococcota bacterium]|nr:aldo/keto reductase [Myxococcota bacterium]